MLDRSRPETLWFLNNHVTVKVAHRDGADGLSVLELRVPFDEAPPLHVHHEEDEIFHILDGDLRFKVGDTCITARAGETLLAPRGVPHGFRVLSREGARFLTITRGGFEAMVRRVARAALSDDLPRAVSPPSPETQAALEVACALESIELLGPPID